MSIMAAVEGEEDEEEEEEKDSSNLFLTLHSWPRSSSTTAVACSMLVFFSSSCVPFLRWQAHSCQASLTVWTRWTVSLRSLSSPAVAYVGLVLLLFHLALCSLLFSAGPKLRIMAGTHQKVCCETALVADIGSGTYLAGFLLVLYLAMSSLPWLAGPNARHHGRCEPEGIFRALRSRSFWFILAMMRTCGGTADKHLGPDNREGNTARGAESPVKPAN